MIKVCHISDNFYPDLGGGPSHIINIINNLEAKHTILTRRKSNSSAFEIIPGEHEVYRYPKYNFLFNDSLNKLRYVSFPFRFFDSLLFQKKIIEKANQIESDIFHVHGASIDSNICSINEYFNKRIYEKIINFTNLGKNKILTLHTCQPMYKSQKTTNGIYNSFIDQFDNIICVDLHIFEYCKKYTSHFNLFKNIYYLPNSLDCNLFVNLNHQTSNDLVVGFSGRVAGSTDFEIINKFCNDIPDGIIFQMALSKVDSKENLLSKNLLSNPKVKIYEDLSTDKMVKFYNSCDLIFNPIKHDAISLVTLEAMSCSKPVIMFDNKYRKFLEENKLGFLIEPKRKDLMLLLNHIKKEKKVLYERGKRSRNYILKNHSNTVVLKKLYNIYNSVAKIK
tara:strand:- start:2650 stop:3825 length:1176 start_codon:yes stop_codon:yes gene_type:complete